MEFTEAKYRFNFENPPEPEVDEQINYPRLKLGEITVKIVEKEPVKTKEEILTKEVAFKDFGRRLRQHSEYIDKHYG